MKGSVSAAGLLASILIVAGCDEAAPPAADAAPKTSSAAAAPSGDADRPAASTPEPAPAAAPGVPAFAVLYPGAVPDEEPLRADGPSGPGGVLLFTSDAAPDDIIAFYRERATAADLRPVMSMNQGDARAFAAAAREANGPTLQVVAAPKPEGATAVQLTWSAGA